MSDIRKCNGSHIGGPGIRIGRSCLHAGPLCLALALGAVTALAAVGNPNIPWWGALIAGLFWPVFSVIGQLV